MNKEHKSQNVRFYARTIVVPGQLEEAKKAYRPEIFSDKIAQDEDVIQVFAAMTRLDYADAERYHYRHLAAIAKGMERYHKINFKQYGMLYMGLRSRMTKGKRGVTEKSIKGISFNFRPNKAVREFLKNITFIKLSGPPERKKQGKKKSSSPKKKE